MSRPFRKTIDLAIAVADQAWSFSGVHSVTIKTSRHRNSDSRYVHINRNLPSHGVIRFSGHSGPNNDNELQVYTRTPQQLQTGFNYALKWLENTYGPKIQAS